MLNDESKIQHNYIVGGTGCGKTRIAMRECLKIRRAGYPIFVASAKARRKKPNGDDYPEVKEWKRYKGRKFAHFVTHDPMQIVRMWDANRLPPSCVVFDEGAVDLGSNPDPLIVDMVALCRADRIKLIILSQNYKDVKKSIRSNCAELRLFGACSDDMRTIASDYCFNSASEVKIKGGYDLAQYSHLHVNKPLRICDIVDKDGGRS